LKICTHESSENIPLKTKVDICRDLKDNYLLSLAVDSKADFLITGDYDLLILEKIENTNIIRFSDFDRLIDDTLPLNKKK